MNWSDAVVLPHAVEMAATTLCYGTRCVSLQFASTRHGGVVRGVFPPGPASLGGRGVQPRYLNELAGTQMGDRTFAVRGTARRWNGLRRDSGVLLLVALEVSVSGGGALVFSMDGSGAISWAPQVLSEGYSDSGEVVVETRAGTSFLSYELAQLALRREAGAGLAYSALVAQGRAEWQRLLGRVRASAGAEQTAAEALELKTMLYTSLYRSLLFPRGSWCTGRPTRVERWRASLVRARLAPTLAYGTPISRFTRSCTSSSRTSRSRCSRAGSTACARAPRADTKARSRRTAY
jgi:hypothetical protein